MQNCISKIKITFYGKEIHKIEQTNMNMHLYNTNIKYYSAITV